MAKATKAAQTETNDNASAARRFERKRAVLTPVYSWKNREIGFFKVTAPIYVGKAIDGKTGEAQKKPADLMPIIDLETGEACEMIVPTVLASALIDKVGEYVGKSFEAASSQREGKKYKDFALYEIEA